MDQDGSRGPLLWASLAGLAALTLAGGGYYYGRMRRRRVGSYYSNMRGR